MSASLRPLVSMVAEIPLTEVDRLVEMYSLLHLSSLHSRFVLIFHSGGMDLTLKSVGGGGRIHFDRRRGRADPSKDTEQHAPSPQLLPQKKRALIVSQDEPCRPKRSGLKTVGSTSVRIWRS